MCNFTNINARQLYEAILSSSEWVNNISLHKDATRFDVNLQLPEHNNETLLFAAVRTGNVRLILYLEYVGSDLSIRNSAGEPCIHVAVRLVEHNRDDIANFLLGYSQFLVECDGFNASQSNEIPNIYIPYTEAHSARACEDTIVADTADVDKAHRVESWLRLKTKLQREIYVSGYDESSSMSRQHLEDMQKHFMESTFTTDPTPNELLDKIEYLVSVANDTGESIEKVRKQQETLENNSLRVTEDIDLMKDRVVVLEANAQRRFLFYDSGSVTRMRRAQDTNFAFLTLLSVSCVMGMAFLLRRRM
eukprot:CFRG1447T1